MRRRNPYIVTYGLNPRARVLAPSPVAEGRRKLFGVRVAGVIGQRMHSIKYQHAEDGKLYEHAFETDVEALAVHLDDGSRAVLLVGRDGQSVWGEY